MANIRTKTSVSTPISSRGSSRTSIRNKSDESIHIGTKATDNSSINSTGDNRIELGNSSGMPRYVGAKAVVDRVEGGVRITLTDYQGTTQEIVAEGGIESIETLDDGRLLFILTDGRTFITDSLIGPQGPPGPPGEPADIESITNAEIEALTL